MGLSRPETEWPAASVSTERQCPKILPIRNSDLSKKKGPLRSCVPNTLGDLCGCIFPTKFKGLIPTEQEANQVDLEEMDFFEIPENRLLILGRENHRCFYTLVALDKDNFVIDHVVSRPNGDNSYRNVVAASREANNRKGSMSAEDFLRKLFREGYLNEMELENRLLQFARLKAGELKPA